MQKTSQNRPNKFLHSYKGAELESPDREAFDRSVYFDEIGRNEHIFIASRKP